MKDTLQARLAANEKEEDHSVSQALDAYKAQKMARELSMPPDDVLLVKSIFDAFDSDGNGSLDMEEFQQAVLKLLELQLKDQVLAGERVKSLCDWFWWEDESGRSKGVNFQEFLRWFASNGFKEDLFLTETQRWVRRLAKHHCVSPDYVEGIHRLFISYDTDQSGTVDLDEFKQVLYKALKVPPNLDLPQSRVLYFWSEIDVDGCGTVVFEKFLAWWLKYFDESSERNPRHMLWDDFYKHVRRVGRLDPPAYARMTDEFSEEW